MLECGPVDSRHDAVPMLPSASRPTAESRRALVASCRAPVKAAWSSQRGSRAESIWERPSCRGPQVSQDAQKPARTSGNDRECQDFTLTASAGEFNLGGGIRCERARESLEGLVSVAHRSRGRDMTIQPLFPRSQAPPGNASQTPRALFAFRPLLPIHHPRPTNHFLCEFRATNSLFMTGT